MARYRAYIQDTSGIRLIPSRAHTYHRSRRAALRALECAGRYSRVNLRGYLWPLSAGEMLPDRLSAGDLPAWVETIAL